MSPIIQVVDVKKSYGHHGALDGVTFDVQRGATLTLLGGNGAGKSTLISLLAGLSQPDAGTIRFDGHRLGLGAKSFKARVGISLRPHGLSPRLNVRETLQFFILCYRGDRPLDTLLKRFRLQDVQDRQIRHLSEGQQQRVALSLVFVKAFDLLLLDEPTAHIDIEGRRAFWEEVRLARERGAAVICSTHLIEEAQQYSDHILVLNAGRPLMLDTPTAVFNRLPGLPVTLNTKGRCICR